MITRLTVNIDHVATLRQARGGRDPEPVAVALLAQSAGAHGISVHLRGDRRHIQERDIRLLRDVLTVPLNVECAATAESMSAVIGLKPNWATLVPETREELSVQGGLDVVFLQSHLRSVIRELRTSDIRASLFIDPNLDQVKMASRIEADAVVFNTGTYANLPLGTDPSHELDRLKEAARLAARLNLHVLAGHSLHVKNVGPVAAIPEVEEINVGHGLISRAMLVGMEQAVKELLSLMREAR